MTNDIEKNDATGVRKSHQAYYPSTRSDIALKSTLLNLYPDNCEVEVRRWLSDLHDIVIRKDGDSMDQCDCPIAAIVYAKTSRHVLSIAVMYDEINDQEIRSVRAYCADRGIRLFPVARLESYTSDILVRAIECEDAQIPQEMMSHLIPEARCPNCGGPMIHKIKRPTSRRNGLYYACAQYLAGHSGAVNCTAGFLCGADEIFEFLDPDYRDLKYRLKNDVIDASREPEWT